MPIRGIETLYLAHPHAAEHLGISYSEMLTEKTGVQFVNPFTDLGSKSEGVVRADLKAIEAADGILALITGDYSIGTSMEIFFCVHMLHKPVFIYVMNPKLADHYWLNEFDGQEVFTNLNKLIQRLREVSR